jgi:hypothetical protein
VGRSPVICSRLRVSPLFHEGAQNFESINLSILPLSCRPALTCVQEIAGIGTRYDWRTSRL